MLLLIVLAAIFLTVYWFWLFRREKLFAFEDRLWEFFQDIAAFLIAKIIVVYRRVIK